MKNKIVLLLILLSLIIFTLSCSQTTIIEEEIETISHIWKQIDISNAPESRWGHEIVYIGDSKIIMFGGYTSATSGETWLYDTTTQSWTIVKASGDYEMQEQNFNSSNFGIANYENKKLIRFGGTNDNNLRMDITWEYIISTTEWKILFTNGLPSARTGTTMSYVGNNKITLFGGQIGDNEYDNDLWEYDIKNQKWTEIKIDTDKPQARRNHVLVYTDDKLILHGGFNGEYLDDLWEYDIKNQKWTEYNVTGNKPTARNGHSIVHIGNGILLMFGGYNGDVLGDTWEYNIYDSIWKEYNTDSSKPPPRYSHSMTYIGNNNIIIFGGKNATENLNDLWLYDFGSITPK